MLRTNSVSYHQTKELNILCSSVFELNVLHMYLAVRSGFKVHLYMCPITV